VGYEGARFVGTMPPYPYWGQQDGSAREILGEVLSGHLEALGVCALTMRFTHASGRSFPVLLTGKIVYEGDQLLGFFNFAISGDYAERLPWNLFGPLRIQAADIEPLVTTVERRLFGMLDLSLLTTREREIVEYLRAGHRPAFIAKALYLSTHTVRNHIKAATRKLGTHSAVELVAALAEGRATRSTPARDEER